MHYISTRGNAPVLGFEDVVMAGLAADGGLYVPEVLPQFTADDFRDMRGLSYEEICYRVMKGFVADSLMESELRGLIKRAYAGFDHRAVTPLRQIGDNLWFMELYRGQTLAFKDVALQFLGQVFDHILKKRQQRITVIGATSGDTGSAAIEACKGSDAVDVFILYPHGRVSDVQRRQMTTAAAAADNVHCLAVEGSFDDCQNMVKAMFNDVELRAELGLTAVNSINWARIMAQIVYYVAAAVALGAPDREVNFAVPTGNFGNVFAAYMAKKMGVPIGKLVIGTNSNDIVSRFFETGGMVAGKVNQTISPSMDIQISSNFERYLFDLHGRDAGKVRANMADFAEKGEFFVSEKQQFEALDVFYAASIDDVATKEMIARVYEDTEFQIDPHSAISVAAAIKAIEERAVEKYVPMVTLGCAHPAKFPDAVIDATGHEPLLPPHLEDLHLRDEAFDVVSCDLDVIKDYVRKNSRV